MSYNLPSRGLVSQADQAMSEAGNVPRSKFLNAWTRKTTFNASDIVPIMVDEILPGDHMRYDFTGFIRMATPFFPIFDNQKIDMFVFFVPARILWTNWVRMHGEQDVPGASIAFTVPQIVSPVGGFVRDSIYDHMGIPTVGQTDAASTISINALPLRAYNLIFNQWFKDQNLLAGPAVQTDNGPDPQANYVLQQRAKQHDYFTSCLPWPYKFTATNIPLTGTAPVTGIGVVGAAIPGASGNRWETDKTVVTAYPFEIATNAGANLVMRFNSNIGVGATNTPKIYADLTAVGFTLNNLRQSWLIQQLLERDARGGTRYTESVYDHFRVRSPDMRLQRAEYIGGGSAPLTLTPVAQTATGGVGVGALGAAGTAVGQYSANYAATEHGYVLALLNVQSDLSYQQGLHLMWTRQTRFDFYYPSLAGLGEQAVLQREIYSTGLAGDSTVFGYQERWHELRTRVSEVTGRFRSTAVTPLDGWHLAEKFAAAPTLNSTFITDQGSTILNRVLTTGAANQQQQYLADILVRRTAVRPMPVFGTPATLGRF